MLDIQPDIVRVGHVMHAEPGHGMNSNIMFMAATCAHLLDM